MSNASILTYTPVEPVTIDFFKAYARLNTSGEDEVLALFLAAAREKAELYCNTHFVSKTVYATYFINQTCPIPVTNIRSVNGFYNSIEELINTYSYFINYQKGIIINREQAIDYDNLPTYTVTYDALINPADVPAAVKTAICKLAADMYENRESTSYNTNSELSISYKSMLAPYRLHV